MSCLTQHKTKEELSNWLMENASDNETTGFLDMLAGDIWSMMNAEEELDEENDCDQDPTPEEARLLETMRKGFMGEIEKLEEENKKLQGENMVLHNRVCQEETANILLRNENENLKETIKKLQEKYEKFRVRNCDRMEELVKALSPWKKEYEDHKRILEAIGELKEENKKLKQKATAWDSIY